MNHLDLWTDCLVSMRGEKRLGDKRLHNENFLFFKKNGSSDQKQLHKEMRTRWEDAVTTRLVEMMKKTPSLVDRIREVASAENLVCPPPAQVSMSAFIDQGQTTKTEVLEIL